MRVFGGMWGGGCRQAKKKMADRKARAMEFERSQYAELAEQRDASLAEMQTNRRAIREERAAAAREFYVKRKKLKQDGVRELEAVRKQQMVESGLVGPAARRPAQPRPAPPSLADTAGSLLSVGRSGCCALAQTLPCPVVGP